MKSCRRKEPDCGPPARPCCSLLDIFRLIGMRVSHAVYTPVQAQRERGREREREREREG